MEFPDLNPDLQMRFYSDVVLIMYHRHKGFDGAYHKIKIVNSIHVPYLVYILQASTSQCIQ